MLIEWKDLPSKMQNDKVREYYDLLQSHRVSLLIKRIMDLILSILILLIIWPLLIALALLIYLEDKGNPIYIQKRITNGMKPFDLYKFRSMTVNQNPNASLVTLKDDDRITKIGHFIRKYRLDELPQLFNIIKGDMTIVGTRPEVSKYIEHYSDEMLATLLLPAGVTSLASIKFKDESELMSHVSSEDVDSFYIRSVLPQKMKYNLKYLRNFNFMYDFKIIFMTIIEVFL